MKETAQSIAIMKTLCVKLQEAIHDSDWLPSTEQRNMAYYVTGIQEKLDNLPSIILADVELLQNRISESLETKLTSHFDC